VAIRSRPRCRGSTVPVNAVFSADGSVAYVLNCGAECGGTQASVQILNTSTTPPTPWALVPVDGATIAFLSGSTLYVAGNSPTNVHVPGKPRPPPPADASISSTWVR
jgi:hypothetical protein